MKVTFENATHAHGPTLAAWVRAQRTYDPGNHPIAGRRVSAWAHGETPPFDTVDRVLTAFGLHVSEVPDECWRYRKRATRPRVDWERRRIAIAAYDRHGNLSAAAREAKVSQRSLRRWLGVDLAPSRDIETQRKGASDSPSGGTGDGAEALEVAA